MELLTSREGAALLAALPRYDDSNALSLASGLREGGYSPQLVAAALTQSRLRAKAEAKFGELARGMLFSQDGLEQATRLAVAAHHAERFRRAGIRQVHDLGCGIGADAMALASLGLEVTAVEIDEATLAIARHNLRHFEARFVLGRAQDAHIPPRHGVWLDPARRAPGHTDARGRTTRVFHLDKLSPSWSEVQHIAARSPTGAKLAPSFPRTRIPRGAQAVWCSLDGEVLECTLWWGPLVTTPGRSALILRGGEALTLTQAEVPEHRPTPVVPQPDGWLYEPDLAVLQAGLVGALEADVEGSELDAGVGYVASAQRRDVPYARRYRVLEVLPAQVKPVHRALKARGAGRVTLKRRGGPVAPDAFRGSLRLSGRGEHATLVLTAVAGRPAVLFVEPA